MKPNHANKSWVVQAPGRRRSGLIWIKIGEDLPTPRAVWGTASVQNEDSGERPTAASDDAPVFLSIVIPAHDEERRLPETFDRIREHLDSQPYRAEIVVVENASRDRTWDVATRAAASDSRIRVLREPLRGKGAAVKRGMLAARGEYRFLCDADLSMPISELENFLPPRLTGVDVAIGSREAQGAIRYEEPARRHLMGRMFNGLIRLLLIPDIQDTQCGFKCFRAEAAEAIFGRTTRAGFSFDVESLVLARCLGFQLREIPVHWYYDTDSRVRVVRDSLAMLVDVLAVWLRLRLGRYEARRGASTREPVARSR